MIQNKQFGLYIHWPFCQSKCPYCDFNSHVWDHIDQKQWKDAYLQSIRKFADQYPDKILKTIYFGGGTPSLMDPELVSAIITESRKSWAAVNAPEITLEANPSSVEAQRFADFKRAGVNRVSIGVQALNDAALRALGRLHSAAEAIQAIEIAAKTYERYSFDLIYARQNQSLDDWKNELNQALSMGSRHLSLYQLTIEPGTVFSTRYAKGGMAGLPSEVLAADMYELTQELAENGGLPAYEISNHANPGEESQHNCIYWSSGDYIGIGPGAHGRITHNNTRIATHAKRDPVDWLQSIKTGSEKEYESLSSKDHAIEYLMMGLRFKDGINQQKFSELYGSSLDTSKISEMVSLGKLHISDNTITATKDGRAVLNSVIEYLIPD